MEFKNREIKLSQEASDDKSGAFSFGKKDLVEIKTNLTEDGIRIIESLFVKESEKIKAISLCSMLAKNKDEITYLSVKGWREYTYRHYRAWENKLIKNNILIKLANSSRTAASEYSINPLYWGDTKIFASKDAYFVTIFKRSRRGKKSQTDRKISVEICYDDWSKEYDKFQLNRGNQIDENDKKNQWTNIELINKTGKIYPKRKENGRLHSKITSLSSFVHAYVKIDGQQVCEIDQHATYTTILPVILKNNKIMLDYTYHVKFDEELCDFEMLIASCGNIYKIISEKTGLSIIDTKQAVNVFLCEKKKKIIGNAAKIKNWFDNWPILSRLLDNLRKHGRLSRELMKIESFIFVGAATAIKQEHKLDVMTKHDAILFLEQNKEIVMEEIKKRLKHSGVINKTKMKIYSPYRPKDALLRKDQGLNEEILIPTNENPIPESREGGDGLYKAGIFESLSPQSEKKTRKRPTKIKLGDDGRYTASVKNKTKYSRKNETLEEFTKRIGVSI